MWQRLPIAAVVLGACAVAHLQARVARGETIFLGPTPYLSAADSPFDLSGLGTTFFLEDFEQTEPPQREPFRTPGIRETSGAQAWGSSSPPFGQSDSVDADDGVIDGNGSGGRSLLAAPLFATGSSVAFGIRLEFDEAVLGGLPSAVGFVLTDTGTGGFFSFEPFERSGNSLGRVELFVLGDGELFGGTAEDRFFGVTHPAGIASVEIIVGGPLDEFPILEIDHVQYGLIVPEPSALLLFAAGIVVFLPRFIFG